MFVCRARGSEFCLGVTLKVLRTYYWLYIQQSLWQDRGSTIWDSRGGTQVGLKYDKCLPAILSF